MSKAVKELGTSVTDDQCKRMREGMSRKTGKNTPATRLMRKHD
jgi:hypothetical protein